MKAEIEQKDKVEIQSQSIQKKELKHVAQIKPHKGHTCFQYNKSSGEITKAEFQSQNINFSDASKGHTSLNKKVVIKDNHLYTTALNEKNARKRFNIMIA